MPDYKEYLVRVYPKCTKYGRMVDGKFQLHREDNFAIEHANGDKFWYLNDKYHREDGPAVEYTDGTKYWYLNGKYYSEANFKLEMQKSQAPTCDGRIVESTKLIAKIENLCLEIDGKKYKLTALSET